MDDASESSLKNKEAGREMETEILTEGTETTTDGDETTAMIAEEITEIEVGTEIGAETGLETEETIGTAAEIEKGAEETTETEEGEGIPARSLIRTEEEVEIEGEVQEEIEVKGQTGTAKMIKRGTQSDQFPKMSHPKLQMKLRDQMTLLRRSKALTLKNK